jgi:peroxiredoxin
MFAASLALPYPLLSDFPGPKVIQSYGVLRPYPKDPSRLVARRSFFLIDQHGVVQGQWFVEDGLVFPSELILDVARKLAGKH